jgi:hypothetical protein
MSPAVGEAIAGLREGILFYPASADDIREPVQAFSPYVNEFWFVDLRYLSGQSPPSPTLPARRFKLLQADEWSPEPTIRLDRDPTSQLKHPWVEPLVRTERYLDRDHDKPIAVHLRKGYGVAAFDKHISTLDVFFCRRDSNDGGSGTLWLNSRSSIRPLGDEVVHRMRDGGLIVTDGSDCPLNRRNVYAHFAGVTRDASPEKALSKAKPFRNHRGDVIRPLGYFGPGYGPTLVWQVEKNRNQQET